MSNREARLLAALCPLLLAARALPACAVQGLPPPRSFAPQEAPPDSIDDIIPAAPQREAPLPRRSEGPWSRQRLEYTPVVYEMPVAPRVFRVDDDGEGGLAATTVAYARPERSQMTYEVRAIPLPDDDDRAGERATLDALTARLRRDGASIQRETPVRHAGYPGVHLQMAFAGGQRTGQLRVLFGRSSAYTALVSYPALARAHLLPDIEHFFAGLELDAVDLPAPAGDGAPGEPRWFDPRDAPFVARFPGAPRREEHTFTAASFSRPRVTYTVAAGPAGERWQVAVTAFDERPPVEALAAAVASLTGSGWTLRGEEPATDQGFVSRRYTLDRDGGALRAALRLYVTESALFEVLAVTAGSADDAPVRAFFQSFRAFEDPR